MQLGLAAGILDIDLLLSSISAVQLDEWQAFYRLYPFGAKAQPHRFALQQANIVNSPHYTRKTFIEPDEFMPCFKAPPQTIAQQIALFKAIG